MLKKTLPALLKRFNSTSFSNYQNNVEVRVRFAPSPTGSIHMGGLRTALYNYIFARQNEGKFILRVEDTDRARIVPGSVDEIEDVLDWVGIKQDEGPKSGGPFGPYLQSERLSRYKERAHELLTIGRAYRCFCSSKRLELLRNYQTRNREKPRYDGKCKNLSSSDIDEKLEESKGVYVIRFKLKPEIVFFEDIIFGSLKTNFEETSESDPVILKSDGYPTYHFANVVDDRAMRISHVLRGSEWISSTSKHIQIYKAFGWPLPVFGHFPLITMKDGTKMSKRNNHGQIIAWRKLGYRPTAILNFLTNMGGGLPKEKQDAMDLWDLEKLVENFNFSSMNCNPASIDLERLHRYNTKDLQQSWLENPEDILQEFKQLLKNHSIETDIDDTTLKTVIDKFISRVTKLNDLVSPENAYVWRHPDLTWSVKDYYDDGWDLANLIQDVKNSIVSLDLHNQSSVSIKLKEISSKHGKDWRQFLRLIRKLLTNSDAGLPVHEIFSYLGKERLLSYLDKALKHVT